MSGLARSRRRFLKPLSIWLGGFLLVFALVIIGWLVWSTLRPPPDGFGPTVGEAKGAVDGSANVLQYTIDARSREDWAYFDFSRGAAVTASRESLDWDLAFRRTDVLTNSGDTNAEGLGGAVGLGEVPLEDAVPPSEGYLVDVTDEERGVENPDLHKWYGYNWTTHIVSSKTQTYALRTATGETVLLKFLSYYCDDGSAACVTFQYTFPADP